MLILSEIWCNTTDAGKRTFDTSWAASYLIHQSIDNLKSEHILSRTSLQAVLFFISWSFGVNLQISPNHHFMLCYVMLCYVIQAGIVLFGFFHLAICRWVGLWFYPFWFKSFGLWWIICCIWLTFDPSLFCGLTRRWSLVVKHRVTHLVSVSWCFYFILSCLMVDHTTKCAKCHCIR